MFVLSDGTASELRRLIGETPGGGVGGQRGDATRQVAYVRCVSWSSGTGTCVVTEYNATTSAWVEFGDKDYTLLLSANGNDLTIDNKYLAIRYGVTGTNKTIFVASDAASGGGDTKDIFVVTKVCPVYAEGILDYVTQERQLLMVPKAWVIGDPVCKIDPRGCCTFISCGECDTRFDFPNPFVYYISNFYASNPVVNEYEPSETTECLLAYNGGVNTWENPVHVDDSTGDWRYLINIACNGDGVRMTVRIISLNAEITRVGQTMADGWVYENVISTSSVLSCHRDFECGDDFPVGRIDVGNVTWSYYSTYNLSFDFAIGEEE